MNNRHDKILFWGCFIAIITTSYAFISRMILCGGQFTTDFGLDKVSAGELQGAGIWPFGVSIIIFSLFIDRIGYKVARMKKKINAGIKMSPSVNRQSGFFASAMVQRPPSTSPPGQPACRRLSHLALSVLNMVVTMGFA